MKATASQRLEQALARIDDTNGQGKIVFTKVYKDEARRAAEAADHRARTGTPLGPLDGAIVSVKDLLDVAGEPTAAGSKISRDAPPAERDADVVRRLRAAGAVIIGKTNMTEYAFSGIGLNPHYGTPGNAHDTSRIPGGSSSGAGVSVASGMAEIAIGSDTGGSIRIPSALNGLVGFKPTQHRVSRDGAFPLSFLLDTLGPLAPSVAAAAATDAVLAGEETDTLAQRTVPGLRIGIPRGFLFSDTQDDVANAFERAISHLAAVGARVSDEALDDLLLAPSRVQTPVSFAAIEAHCVHKDALTSRAGDFDPFVHKRIMRGRELDAPSYVGMVQERARLMPVMDQRLADFDVLALPTVPFVAPKIADVQSEEDFVRTNVLILRNPSVFNFYDLPALSLPIPHGGPLPIGLMLVGQRGRDRELLAVGAAIETELSRI
ncbi:amidase [Microvirga flavescens]|uniref:amidase n=1 Tax=Microvirga flavescens TaxID=2249811 RepID=UPI000DD5518C|nr:amidase [Microvirga flavescens]